MSKDVTASRGFRTLSGISDSNLTTHEIRKESLNNINSFASLLTGKLTMWNMSLKRYFIKLLGRNGDFIKPEVLLVVFHVGENGPIIMPTKKHGQHLNYSGCSDDLMNGTGSNAGHLVWIKSFYYKKPE